MQDKTRNESGDESPHSKFLSRDNADNGRRPAELHSCSQLKYDLEAGGQDDKVMEDQIMTAAASEWMSEEERLLQKLQRLEALFAGAYADGERAAAANAIDRIRERLNSQRDCDPPVEYTFTLQDAWSRKLMLALMRRYGLEPYRYRGQRHTTVMARVPKSFVDQTLWPEFQQFSETLQKYLDEVTDRIISEALGADLSEAATRTEPAMLPGK